MEIVLGIEGRRVDRQPGRAGQTEGWGQGEESFGMDGL